MSAGVFGASGKQRFHIKKTTRKDILCHFSAHHVFKIVGHVSIPPTLLQYRRRDGTIEQSGLFTLEETEDMNSIPSAYQHEPRMVALSRLVIFLAAQPKNKVLVYDLHANMDYNAFRKCLEEHELFITSFPGNRSTLQLKRLRESIEAPEKHVIVVGDCQGKELHFPSVTHIVVVGDGDCGAFIGRATRYGLMVGRPIVKINFSPINLN
jgi:hypothetical protein